MTFQTPNPFLYQLREGSLADPYIDRVETLTPVDGRIVLSEIPVRQNGVLIDGHIEIDSNTPTGSQFYVDYTYGVVYFVPTKNTSVTARYKGRGTISLPSDRVFYKKDTVYKSIDAHLSDMNISVENYRMQLSAIQTQVNQLIVNGDSSPESAQARIGFDNKVYKTLKDRIDSEITSKATGSPKGVYATLSALQSAKPNGDSSIYLVTANGNWYFWNGTAWMAGGVYQATATPPNSITGELIQSVAINYLKHVPQTPLVFKTQPKNLFNKNAVTTGKYVKYSDGTLADNTSYSTSEFISVKPGVNYTFTYRDQSAWYDGNKNYISGISGGAGSPYTVASPANAYYLRVSTTLVNLSTQMVEESAVATAYEPYYTELKVPASDYFKDGTVTDAMISDAFKTKVNRILTPMEILAKELNDKTRSVRIKLLGDSITHGMGGTGYAEDGDLIPGTTVRMNPNGYCWANSLKTLLNSKYNGLQTFSFDDPKIVLKTLSYVTNPTNYQFPNNVAGVTLLEFKFKGDEARVIYTSYANGGKVDVYLDGVYHSTIDAYSSTQIANVEHVVTGAFGEHTLTLKSTGAKNASAGGFLLFFQGIKFNRKVVLLNYAQSGKNSNNIYLQRDTLIETGDDFVIMQLGTNDRHNMPSTTDTKRYQRAIIETAYSKGAKVILMSSIPTTVVGDNDPIRNFGMFDVDRAIRELAFEYNMGYISNYDGFLEFGEYRNINVDTLLADGLHPNDAGYDVMFRNIVRKLGIHYVRTGVTK